MKNNEHNILKIKHEPQIYNSVIPLNFFSSIS